MRHQCRAGADGFGFRQTQKQQREHPTVKIRSGRGTQAESCLRVLIAL